MAVRILDLRKQPERITFEKTTKDDIRYSEAFWQSVRLQPTLESRLVSSDIKQRLGKRNTPSSKSGASTGQFEPQPDVRLNALFVQARTLDQIERFQRLAKLAEAREQDRNMLHKRREERIKKEQISRNKVDKPKCNEDAAKEKVIIQRKAGEAYIIEEMFRDIDEFEKKKAEYRRSKLEGDGYPTTVNKNQQAEPEVIVLVSPIGQ